MKSDIIRYSLFFFSSLISDRYLICRIMGQPDSDLCCCEGGVSGWCSKMRPQWRSECRLEPAANTVPPLWVTWQHACFFCLHTTQQRMSGGKCPVDIGGQRSQTQIITGYTTKSRQNSKAHIGTAYTVHMCTHVRMCTQTSHFNGYLSWQGEVKYLLSIQ